MVRSHCRSRYRPGAWVVVALAAFLASSRNGATKSADISPPKSAGPTARPIAIEVRDGRARFDLPMPRTSSQTLLIVSALARSRGPFPIRLTVQPSLKTKPIETVRERPSHVRPKLEPLKLGPAPPIARGLPPASRTFHLLAHAGDFTRAANYQAVEGRLRAVGRRIQIYVDSVDFDAVTLDTLQDLVSTFDEKVYPDAAARFGQARDVDRDGRFTVLFSSRLAHLGGGKSSVDGFMRGADLDANLDPPFGNRCDMMYLNTALKAGPHLRTIVAHEYTHAVNFSGKLLADGRFGLEEEGWLDEGLAHLVEDEHNFSRSNIDYRVSAFLSAPERYRLVVDDYYAADLFRSHGNRGATYLFLRWCVDVYGPGLVDALVCSGRRGIDNLEAATGSTFAELFRKWTVALYLSGLDPASSTEDLFHSIDLRGEFEDWILAGPRTSVVAPGGPPDQWVAEGTSAHFAIVEGSTSGAVSIEVDGPREAQIQVTAVPLPEGLGRPELKMRSLPGPAGEVRVQVEITERQGTAVRLGAMAWEPLLPVEAGRSSGFSRGGIDMLGIASCFGTSALPAKGSLRSPSIPLKGLSRIEGPVIVKLVGTDPRGRRVAAWTSLAASDPKTDPPPAEDLPKSSRSGETGRP